MDEKKKEEIRNEARKILDKFGKALKRVKFKEKEFKKAEEGYRKEGNGLKTGNDFRQRMFNNAPAREGDCIIAEKKKW